MIRIVKLAAASALLMCLFWKGASAQTHWFPTKTAQSRKVVPNEKNLEFQRAMALKREEKFSEAAEIFSKISQDDPKNADALQQLATLYGWLGRYEDSITAWKKAIALVPKNYEYHLGLARVLGWKGDLIQGKEEYLKAYDLNKDDFDTLLGLGDIEMRLGNISSARDYYLLAQKVKPDDPVLKNRLGGSEPPLKWRIDAGYLYDGYHDSTFRVAEQNSYAQITRAFAPGNVKSSLWIRHEWQYHFQLVDNTIYTGGSLWPIKALAIQAEAGFTPTPNFQPTQQYKMVLEFPLSKYFIPSVGVKYLAYRDGNVNLYTPALRIQPFSWIGVTYQHLFSKNISPPQDTEGWQLKADLQMGESVSSYFGYAQGKESLPSAPGGVLRTSFNETTFLGLILQLGRRWSWRVDYSYEERPNFYIRSSLGSGLTFKF